LDRKYGDITPIERRTQGKEREVGDSRADMAKDRHVL